MKSRTERKNMLYLCAFFALILALTGAGTYYVADSGGNSGQARGSEQDKGEKRAVRVALDAPYFYVFPEMSVALRAGRCRAPHVRFEMAVQINEHLEALLEDRSGLVQKAVMLQTKSYQRSDLTGPEGADRLRSSIESVVNKVLSPARVQRVLLSEMTLH